MTIARTLATGAQEMMPELLRWSSSLSRDLAMAEEDLAGSLAHVLMLARCRLVPAPPAEALRTALAALLRQAAHGTLQLPAGEEDIHMAVERQLAQQLGDAAHYLHTARSRNDQVALDLRLWARERGRRLLLATLQLVDGLLTRALEERDLILPAYTHRQRAQPVSLALYLLAWANGLLRAAQLVAEAVGEADVLPLGVGATSGTSLPIDRVLTARLLGFARLSENALDTVGDRDFSLDLIWSSARVQLVLSRLGQDLVDFASQEFALVVLDDAISAGSSMMPHKKNPDAFELLRGKSAGAIGRVMHLYSLVRSLPTGYSRDLQEDRAALFDGVTEAIAAVEMAHRLLPHVRFDGERGEAMVAAGPTQATDVAEALVSRGVPFRLAYRAVGALLHRARSFGVAPAALPLSEAVQIHPAFDSSLLDLFAARPAVARKESAGGTGPRALDDQLTSLRVAHATLTVRAGQLPHLGRIIDALCREPLLA